MSRPISRYVHFFFPCLLPVTPTFSSRVYFPLRPLFLPVFTSRYVHFFFPCLLPVTSTFFPVFTSRYVHFFFPCLLPVTSTFSSRVYFPLRPLFLPVFTFHYVHFFFPCLLPVTSTFSSRVYFPLRPLCLPIVAFLWLVNNAVSQTSPVVAIGLKTHLSCKLYLWGLCTLAEHVSVICFRFIVCYVIVCVFMLIM